MDVPISVGVIMAFGLSLYDTLHDAPHAYFDAATSLLFFLLIGRTLDHVMREKARSAVAGLARLAPRGATVVDADGQRRYAPVAEIEPGESILVAAGDRIPLDGMVTEGASDLDCSLVSGEATPRYAGPGATVQAGVMNLTGPLTIRTTARAAKLVPCRNGADDGGGRGRKGALPPAGRPGLARSIRRSSTQSPCCRSSAGSRPPATGTHRSPSRSPS